MSYNIEAAFKIYQGVKEFRLLARICCYCKMVINPLKPYIPYYYPLQVPLAPQSPPMRPLHLLAQYDWCKFSLAHLIQWPIYIEKFWTRPGPIFYIFIEFSQKIGGIKLKKSRQAVNLGSLLKKMEKNCCKIT